MEKINKYNYEAYFLDYLEGNLSAEEKHDLFIFLDQNPELKKELDVDFSDVSLDPSAVVFENKPALKIADDDVLTLNNVEVWMLESVEGNLNASKQQELDDFVRKHQLQKTYTAYQSTILHADLNEVYIDKKKLKVVTGTVIPLYVRVASIAAVGIVLIGVALNRFAGSETPALAETSVAPDFVAKTTLSEFGVHTNDQTSYFTETSEDEKNVINKNNQIITPPSNNMLVVVPENQEDKEDTTGSEKLVPPGNDIVEKPDSLEKENLQPDSKDDVVIITPFNSEYKPSIVTEEPYKLVTTAASNFTNREVQFTRDKNTSTNEYVAYGFKVGNFEFERKKSE